MNFELVKIENPGDLNKERVVLKAKVDTDVGDFAIFRGKRIGDRIQSGNIISAYWFPNKEVKAGDFVVLYSKIGESSEKVGETGRASYFYYWGKTSSCWDTSHTPVLVATTDWLFLPPA